MDECICVGCSNEASKNDAKCVDCLEAYFDDNVCPHNAEEYERSYNEDKVGENE